MNGLTQIAPVVLICGNHDYRQENPDNPDLIDVMCECLKTRGKYPYYYFKDTNVYRIENIQFGVVSIKDTLKATSTSGIEENLPTFPSPIFDDCVSVALFHGTITQSKLPNGMEMKAGHGYPLEWFKGYSMLLLGDNHKQQIHTSQWGMPWGYPGSLIQQDFGEPVYGHGFLLWDIKSMSATPHHIYNPYGKLKVRYENDKIHVKLSPDQKNYRPLEEIVKTFCFPTKPFISLNGSIADQNTCMRVFKKYNIHPIHIRMTAPTLQDQWDDTIVDEDSLANAVKDIATLNNPERWLDYLNSLDPLLAEAVKEKRWMELPAALKIASVPAELSKDLHDLTGKVREKIQGLIDIYEKTERSTQQTKHSVVLKHMSWNWVYSYGANNWFNFEKMEGKIGILNGKNASGKSSFIDTLCIGLFGEPTPNRQINTHRKISSHCIHTARPTGSKGESMSVKVLFTVDGKLYEIHRKYIPSVKDNECKCISVELYSIHKDSDSDLDASGKITLLYSGTTLVNQWVELNLGTMDELIKTSIVSQMDSHNFFFAKPEQQKAMIDHAVNLKELDDYSKIIHEAYNGYTNVLKMTTTILNTAESHLEDEKHIEQALLTDNERKALDEKRLQMETHCKNLETTKERLCIQLGHTWQSQRPDEIEGLSTKAEWEQQRLSAAEQINLLKARVGASGVSVAFTDSIQDCLNKLSVLEHKQNTLQESMEHTPETEDLKHTVLDCLRAEEVEKELLWKQHGSLKPTLERSKALMEEDQYRLDAWYQQYQTYLDSSETYVADKTLLEEEWNQMEAEYTQWVNHRIDKRDWFSSIPKKKKPICLLSFINPEMSWMEKREAYHQYLSYYEKIEALKSTLDSVRVPEKEPEWLKRLQEYEDWVSQCEENNWTDIETLQKNLQETLEYQEKRLAHDIEFKRLEEKRDAQQEILSKYPNWKKERKAFKKLEDTYHPHGYTMEHVWTQLAKLKEQTDIWDAEDASIEALEETVRSLKADPWWEDQWNVWQKKQAACLKLGWADSQALEAYIELLEEQSVLLIEKEHLQQALDSFQQKGSHPDCQVCWGRQAELKAAIEAIDAQLQVKKDSKHRMHTTHAELQDTLRKSKKDLTKLKWVEDMKSMIESEHRKRITLLKTHETKLQDLLNERSKRPSRETWDEQRTREEAEWQSIQSYLSTREKKLALYETLVNAQEQHNALLKKSKKLGDYINCLLSKEALKETEGYWRNAIEIYTTVQRLKEPMEAEKISWEHARSRLAAMKAEMEAFEINMNIKINRAPTSEEIVACYTAVYNEWESVGSLLAQQKTALKQRRDTLKGFEIERDEYHALKLALEKEAAVWEAYALWEKTNDELKQAYLLSSYRCLLKETAELTELKRLYGVKEDAERALIWFELQELNRDIAQASEAYREINERCLQDDSYRSLSHLQSKKHEWQHKYSVLKSYLETWKTECELLGKIDRMLVGEKGFGVGQLAAAKQKQKLLKLSEPSAEPAGEAPAAAPLPSTYKEWVYENRVLPILEHHVNRFLSQIGIELVFHIRYKAKSLEFQVKDRGNETSFASSSGFQQFVIGLGMRQALAQIGGSGNNIQHMFIDEGFTACDTENIEKAYDILQLLCAQGHYKSILLVSHLDSIKDVISLKIPLERKDAFSKLHYGEPYPNYGSQTKRMGRPPKNTHWKPA
jgi:DNA repair exonuclease SbcCD ATPase subunit